MRVRRARAELLQDAPFYGLLATRLQLVEDPSCDTMWVDGVSLGYSPRFVDSISDVEIKGVLCHEVLHVVAGHPWRYSPLRDHETWQEACDYAINPLCLEEGYRLPGKFLFEERFVGLSAEPIYRLLSEEKDSDESDSNESGKDEQTQEGEQGEGGGDSSDGPSEDAPPSAGKPGEGRSQPSGPTRHGDVRPAPAGADAEATDDFSQEGWATAIEAARVAQGTLSAGLSRLLGQVKLAKVSWREVVMDLLQKSSQACDYSWSRPDYNYLSTGLYLPHLESENLPPVVIVVDTSGSMPDSDLRQATMQAQVILDTLQPEELVVLSVDARVCSVQRFQPGDEVKFEAKGGGGTDFRPAFTWVAQKCPEARAVIYFTDLEGAFPDAKDVDLSVVWVATSQARSSSLTAPFGTVVCLSQ